MGRSSLRARYWRILAFFAGVIGRFIFWELLIARLGLRAVVRRTRAERFRRDAVRFRALAIIMGGVMIKVGQFLSSRLDILPAEVTDELAGLQDEVPAEDFDAICSLAERELGAPIAEKFAWFDPEPLAAASFGQVHRARLRVNGTGGLYPEAVVVKIQRPYIEQLVEVDLAALRRVGGWLMRYRPIRDHADVPALVREFSTTVSEEIDYEQEGRNADTFRANFADDPDVRVPRVIWDRTTRRVLTLEDVFAIKITDYAALTAAGINRREVACKLLDTYLQQIFEDNFFHADPHPGNLFVTPLTSDDDGQVAWKLTFVDFGMVGRVQPTARDGLREMLVGVGTRDATRVVRSYQMLGMLLPGADVTLIAQAEQQVFDRFWGMPMSELRKISTDEMRKFGHQFRDLLLNLPFQVPQDLLMLVRSVSILSGICTGLDANFNLWEQISPYARKLITQDGDSGLQGILDQLGEMAKLLLALPGQASRVMDKFERGELVVQNPQMTRRVASLEKSVDRLTGGVVFAALLVGGVLLYNAGNILFGDILLVISLLALGWAFFRR